MTWRLGAGRPGRHRRRQRRRQDDPAAAAAGRAAARPRAGSGAARRCGPRSCPRTSPSCGPEARTCACCEAVEEVRRLGASSATATDRRRSCPRTSGSAGERVVDPGRRTCPAASGGGCSCSACSMGEPNVLLLDEPTNDLDTDTLAALEDLLDSWPGTLLVVSPRPLPGRAGLRPSVALLGDGRIRDLPGGVDEYLARCGGPALSASRGPRPGPSRRPRRPVGPVGRRAADGAQGDGEAGAAAGAAGAAGGAAARAAGRARHRPRGGARAGRRAAGVGRRSATQARGRSGSSSAELAG